MSDRVDSLQRMVQYGKDNGKHNIIADLDTLQELFEQRDQLLKVVRCVGSSLAQTTEQIPPIVTRDLAEQCNRINQELNLP